MNSIEISARTVAEAVELALSQLGRDRDEVAIAVLESGEDGEEALVRVTVVDDDSEGEAEAFVADEVDAPAVGPTNSQDVAALARSILEELLKHMDIHGYVTAVHSHDPGLQGSTEETITLHVEGADEQAMGLLIGRRGETLASIQFLINLMVSRKVRKWPQMVVDVGNYRQRRRESLEGLARRMAERVRQTGRSITLEPMASYERRLVHLALREDATVYTQSTGEGEGRKITIYPAKS
ncbi:MAG: KH domain-containing protein [Chloroflexaceae bacterium]|nr:KH domain-containing protein [Chloroflexaceae bacterium]NJO04694.1 KH domain-containing protein [Chloroflexaceae bacterium]